MQSADPVLTRRKPPPNGGSGDSSGEEPAPQIANKQAKPPAGADRPQDTSSSLLLSIIIALLISASMFTYFYMNLKQAGIIKETQKYRDINAELKVELADIIKGSDISFDIKRQAVCTKCQGTGARSKDDIVVCQHCRGRGSQTVKQRMGPMTWEVEQRCPYCGGAGKTIKHKCDVCHGSTVLQVENRVDIKLPKGAPEGYILVVEERGDEAPGYAPGNLNLKLTTTENSYFKRSANNIDLEYHMVLSLLEALVGFERDIELPTGEMYTLKRTTVTQHDERIVVSGKGVPKHSGYGSGDLIIHVSVSFPDVLSNDDKKLVEQLLKK